MLRHLRRILIGLVALVVLAVGALAIIATVYEDEVKQKLVGALNERLLSPVTMSDMDLTLIARFPMASMRLRNVKVDEVRTDGVAPDTLLAANEIFLEFNLWDLFDGDYRVQSVHGDGVQLNPGFDANGAENYRIWKSDSTASASPIDLQAVTFNELGVRYFDDRTNLVVQASSEELALHGTFGDTLNELEMKGDVGLRSITRKGAEILGARQADVDVAMDFGNGAFRIKHGEVRVDGVPLSVTMAMAPGEHGRTLDLRANGLGLDLSKAIALLPAGARKSLERFNMGGDADVAIHYAGELDGEGPALSIGAKLTKCRMKERRSGATFTDVYGELALDLSPKGEVRKLKVKDLSAKTADGHLNADWLSAGTKKAAVKADIQCDLGLADLLRFAGVDTLEQVGGRLRADVRIDGTLRDMGDPRPADLSRLKITGMAALDDASLKMKGIRHRVEHVNTELSIAGNDATVRGLKAVVQGNAIELNGALKNLVPFLLFDQEHLVIEARGRSEHLDLAALLQRVEGTAVTTQDYVLVLPVNIELDLRAQVGTLVFEQFRATDITGTVRLKDRVLRVSPMAFNTAGGAGLGSLQLDGTGGERAPTYPLAIDATIKDMDVKELFREFQDFGQGFIGARHLSGTTHANIAFAAPLAPSLTLDRDRMQCTIDIAVDNGGIKGQEQLIAIADYLRKNKLVSPFVNTDELRKRLADVRFAHLENRIEIANGAAHVPVMEVKSNTLDIELSGTQWFDGRIDHHVNFRLGDLFRLDDPQDDEFGPIADDGTGMRVFLHMYGTTAAPQFENDGAMAAAKRRQKFQQEKQALRAILREDIFGRKPDTVAPPIDPNKPRIRIEMEGDT
ncbi:MAG TPA: AsmA-like C-terminal region-containing protein, partial [Flavobacteriales bacterium]|nr:AsmA-like C-terminal region-containing protein [Flavobacteriales bacterium]